MTRVVRSATAEFQILDALRQNRQTRNRENAFIVEGVRNVNAARANGWTVRQVLAPAGAKPTAWATEVRAAADVVELAPALFQQLTDRDDPPEVLLVCEKRVQALDALPPAGVLTVLDRPNSPGNIGTITRTTDALGGSGVVVLGHAADPYDPRAVRASTGSFFALPVVEVSSAEVFITWAQQHSVALVATDETGDAPLDQMPADPVALLLGNETSGLSRRLREAAPMTAAIPMTGSASSLNVAAAHAIVLFSATQGRARRRPSRHPQ